MSTDKVEYVAGFHESMMYGDIINKEKQNDVKCSFLMSH